MKKLASKIAAVALVAMLSLTACGGEGEGSKSSANTSTSAGSSKSSTNKTGNKLMEIVQNAPVYDYQDIKFKDFLAKWSNVCKNISWENRLTSTHENGRVTSLVLAFCELPDGGAKIREKMLAIAPSGKQADYYSTFWRNLFDNIQGYIPGGSLTLDAGQLQKLFDFGVKEGYWMSATQAVEQAQKVHLVFRAFVEVRKGEDGEIVFWSKEPDTLAVLPNTMAALSVIGGEGGMYAQDGYGINPKFIDKFSVAFEIDGKKYVPWQSTKFEDVRVYNIQKSVFFNKKMEQDFFEAIAKGGFGRGDFVVDKLQFNALTQREAEIIAKKIADETVKIYSVN